MITPVNRETVRDALAAALGTGLTSAQAVYGYQRGGFDGQTPVVRVMSAGSFRTRFTAQGGRGELFFLVQAWVLYADPALNWTEAQAEDRLDQLEFELATWMENNRNTQYWSWIEYAGRSFVNVVKFQGQPYLVEDIPVLVKVF